MARSTKRRPRSGAPPNTPPGAGVAESRPRIAAILEPTLEPERWLAAGGRPTCRGCVAHCCRYIAVEIDAPRAKWQYDQIYWMLLHQNVAVYQELDGGWYVEFTTRCKELTERNLCATYETRPQLCRDYSNESCSVWNKDELYKVRFEDAESFAGYLDRKGVDWRYDWQKEAARAGRGPALRREEGTAPGPAPKGSKSRRPPRPRSRAASGGTGPARSRSPRA